jgi:hypothetical protein
LRKQEALMAVHPHKIIVGPNLQFSTDAGKTWSFPPRTLDGKTILAGFEPGQTVWLRHRPLTPDGAADWSAPIALIIK